MSCRRVTVCVGGVLLLAGLVGPASGVAAAPEFERITVNDTFFDEGLSEACGVPVTGVATGHVTLRTFAGGGPGRARVTPHNRGVGGPGGGGTFRVRDGGADVTRVEPDGSVLLLITGQVPFEFAGALMVDPETEEVILEPKSRTEAQLAKACAVLTS